MEKTLAELKEEADSLGISYSANIGAAKLQEKIDAHDQKLMDEADEKPVKSEAKVEDKIAKADNPRLAALRVIKEQERLNRETIVVKISMVDKREASYATSAYFNTGSTAMRVPLDEWVEMPKILVHLAETKKSLIHIEKDGTSVPKLQKTYVVEYKDR